MTFAGNSASARPPRVVCIGDSITFGDTGLGYIAPRPWPLIAGERLGAELVNCGHCGASTVDYRSLPEWTRACTALPGANLVTVMLGTNDIAGGHARDEAALRRVIERYESIVADVQATAGPGVPVAALTIAQFALGEPIFSRFTYDELVVMNRAVDRFNALLRDAAARHGWHVVEMTGVIDGRRDLYGNTIHPNDRGYEVMADVVTPRLARLLDLAPEGRAGAAFSASFLFPSS